MVRRWRLEAGPAECQLAISSSTGRPGDTRAKSARTTIDRPNRSQQGRALEGSKMSKEAVPSSLQQSPAFSSHLHLHRPSTPKMTDCLLHTVANTIIVGPYAPVPCIASGRRHPPCTLSADSPRHPGATSLL